MTRVAVEAAGVVTFQDRGRPAWAHLGVPHAGAFERQRYELLCRLLGTPGAACLEILDGRLTVEALDSPVDVAVIAGTVGSQGHLLPSETVLSLSPGDLLEVTRDSRGPAYVGITGLTAPEVLGSSSYDSLSRLGPAPLVGRSEFPVTPLLGSRAGTFLRADVRQNQRAATLRVVSGPQWDDAAAETSWVVTATARSGVRLQPDGDVTLTGSASLASFPVHPGCIQLPPSGESIILGPDSGVTGGYPVLASVISADLPLIAHLTSGDRVSYISISPAEAEGLWTAKQAETQNAVFDVRNL